MPNLNEVRFYSTNDGGAVLGEPEPIILDMSSSNVVPGLKDGLVGAKKGEIRRIIVRPRQTW